MANNNGSSVNESLSSADHNDTKLELKIVAAWQSKAWWLWLLLPISWLYGLIIFIRRSLYKLNILKSYHPPVPVLIVGNITVGGSGKTPLIIQLVHFLQSQGIKVGVISRGYGGNESIMPTMVTTESLPEEVGDEPYMIVSETGVAMSVSPNRQLAIECLLANTEGVRLIIADDGLQHYKLKRDVEWIVVDSARGFGNKQLLPTGFLREPMSRLKNSTVIYHQPAQPINTALNEEKTNYSNELTMHLKPGNLISLVSQKEVDKETFLGLVNNASENHANQNIKVYAVSGIGYPQRFFNTLTELGFDVIPKPMPDHHKFVASDLSILTEYPIIITSKDAVKILPLIQKHSKLQKLSIWVLTVEAVLSDACYTTLMSQLQSFNVTH